MSNLPACIPVVYNPSSYSLLFQFCAASKTGLMTFHGPVGSGRASVDFQIYTVLSRSRCIVYNRVVKCCLSLGRAIPPCVDLAIVQQHTDQLIDSVIFVRHLIFRFEGKHNLYFEHQVLRNFYLLMLPFSLLWIPHFPSQFS